MYQLYTYVEYKKNMSTYDPNHHQALLKTHQERLEQLEIRAARYGFSVDPSITLEIQQIRETINGLKNKDTDRITDDNISQIAQSLTALEKNLVSTSRWRGLKTLIAAILVASLAVFMAYQVGSQMERMKIQPTLTTIYETATAQNNEIIFKSTALARLATQATDIVSVSPTPILETIAPIAVDSTKPWQYSGLNIQQGDILTIHVVSGKWTIWRVPFPTDILDHLAADERNKVSGQIWINKWRETNGQGSSPCRDHCPLPDFSTGGLLAKIGQTIYGVSDNCTFTATQSGRLFLQINDTAFDDNAGILAVEVSIGKKDNPTSVRGCGAPYP